MPPKRNNNKQAQIARKNQITKRLMAISLKVDKYIYKNKPITISLAQMYLEELASFKCQCLEDAPSLQVCEKLTCCMRGIIEEQQSNDAVLEDTETFIQQNRPSKMYAASPVYSLPDDDKTQMACEPIEYDEPENNKSSYNLCNENSNTHEEKEQNNIDPIKSVRFYIDDDKTKYNNASVQINYETLKINTDFDNESILNTNVDTELTNVIVDLILEDNEQPIDNDLGSQSLLKDLEVKETPKTVGQPFINDICGQDMAEFDREVINLVEPKEHGSIENNRDTVVAHEYNTIKQNTPATIKKIPDVIKTHEIAKQPTELFNSLQKKQKIKNKPTKDVKIQKKRATKNKNKDNKPQTKRRINKTDSKITENDVNTGISTPLTNNSDETLEAPINTIKISNMGSNIGQNANKNNEIENDPNIVTTPGTKNSSKAFQIVGPNISTLTDLKIVCIEDNLSWVENLTHIREIHFKEYDPTLKSPSEYFWDNCELPDNWDDRDFEWT